MRLIFDVCNKLTAQSAGRRFSCSESSNDKLTEETFFLKHQKFFLELLLHDSGADLRFSRGGGGRGLVGWIFKKISKFPKIAFFSRFFCQGKVYIRLLFKFNTVDRWF